MPATITTKIRLSHVRINAQGYDSTGYYWGRGKPLYYASDDGDWATHLRAYDRNDAKIQLEKRFPGIEFYR